VSATALDVGAIRKRFSSLRGGFAFFDAPGGTQVPDEVADAVARALWETGGMQERVPTYLLNVDGVRSQDPSRRLAERGMDVWSHTHRHALGLRDRLPYPGQALRVGFAHYTTAEEVDRRVAELTAAGREASAGVT
jgi:selenocysteine lyase/cysteine desulfurase